MDIVRGSDWVTVSWNYFHDHYKTNLIGNDPAFRDIDGGRLHVTFHHNHYSNCGTRGPAGRFGHQHVYNNYYEDSTTRRSTRAPTTRFSSRGMCSVGTRPRR